MLLGSISLTVSGTDAIDSGNFDADGNNFTWTFYNNGGLVISGKGDMGRFSEPSETPWFLYQGDIKSVVIGNGITSIGANIFYGYSSIETVTITDSVTVIDGWTFYNCSSLKYINIPK